MNKALLTVAFAASLYGCGGGSSAPQQSIVSGKVIDGYIEGAIVCLDLNGNLACDQKSEPWALTLKDGSYSIPYNGSVDGLVVIAFVGDDAKDADDGGKTIKEANKAPFNLAAPIVKSGVSSADPGANLMVTPLTTLVTHEALADPAIKLNAAAVADAQAVVKTKLGLKTDVLGVDYVNSSKDLHDLAKVVSIALGETAKEIGKQLTEKSKSDTALAASKDSAEAQKLVQNSVAKTVLDSVMPSLVDKETGKLSVDVEKATTAVRTNVTTTVTGVINNIIAGTKTGAGEVADLKSLFKAGIIFADPDNGFRPRDPSKNMQIGDWIWADNLDVEYNKGDFDAQSGESLARTICKYDDSRAKFCNGQWVEEIEGDVDYVLSTSGEWKQVPEFNPVNTRIKDNCLIENRGSDVAGFQACLYHKTVAGKKIVDLIPQACDQFGSHTPPSSCKSATFKPGAIGFDITLSTTLDEYSTWLEKDPARRTWHYGKIWLNGAEQEAKTVSDFIKLATTASNSNPGFRVFLRDGFSIRFEGYSENNGRVDSATVQWTFKDPENSNSPYEPLPSTSTAVVRTPYGKQDVLVLATPPKWHEKNPGDRVGRDFIFVAIDGGIQRGNAEYAKVKRQLIFGTGNLHGNREMLDSVIEAAGLPAFPYNQATPLRAP
jgi:hypothetical protein